MAGGTFDKLAGKKRPGTYINVESSKRDLLGISERGIVVIPLLNHTYGPVGEFIELTTDAPDSKPDILGYSIYDEDTNRMMLLIREAFKRAAKVLVYKINGGTKATVTYQGIVATAKYSGTRGNSLAYSIVENPVSGKDLEVHLDGVRVAFIENVTDVASLNDQKYIDFSGTPTTGETTYAYNEVDEPTGNPKTLGYYEADSEPGTYKATNDTEVDAEKTYYTREEVVGDGGLPVVAGKALIGGTDTTATNNDVTAFLDKLESVRFNTLCFPITDTSLQAAAKTKIKYIREKVGRGVQVVMPNTSAKDYKGVINGTNSVGWIDTKVVDGKSVDVKVELTAAEACAWVAAAEAAATCVQSLTEEEYDGATFVVNPKTSEEAEIADENGEFFFTVGEGGDVIVEYDINSLVTFTKKEDKSYRKNRVIRVHDAVSEAIRANFKPNKFDNEPVDWDAMEGIGKAILKQYGPKNDGGIGAIKNIDYSSDFLVDRTLSEGDETYFNVGLQAVDSAEKLYFTISTR